MSHTLDRAIQALHQAHRDPSPTPVVLFSAQKREIAPIIAALAMLNERGDETPGAGWARFCRFVERNR